MRKNLLIALIASGCAGWLQGGEAAESKPEKPAEAKSVEPTPAESQHGKESDTPPLKQTGPGQFQVGQVRFNSKERKLHFPAFINMEAGLIEYLIVTGTGKLHESLLWTQVEPYHIHVAMLFIGAKTSAPVDPFQPEPFIGEKVTIEVAWKEGEAEKRFPIERFVNDLSTGEPINRGPWVYNGSRVINGTFLAQRDGSIVSLIEDPDALMNNQRTAGEHDENWTIRKDGLPEPGSRVEVILSLPESEKKNDAVEKRRTGVE
jgi:hypothetical protein